MRVRASPHGSWGRAANGQMCRLRLTHLRRSTISTARARGAAALLQPKASDHLLDIGCGIGGPARWIGIKYGCRVTGVNLTAEFCEAARELNSLTGLADRVQVLRGSALSLPLPDNSFDRAYSQAALMNVSDKRGAFREALRVLRPGGSLALSLAGAGSAGDPRYPLPWAPTPDISFLATPDELRGDLLAAGFSDRPSS